MLKQLSALLYRFPPSFRLYVKGVLRPVMNLLRWTIMGLKDLKMPVRQIQSQGVKIIFIGHEAEAAYLIQNLFGCILEPVYVKDVSILNLRTEVKKLSLKSDMIVVSANSAFLSLCNMILSFDIPNLVGQSIVMLKHNRNISEKIFDDLGDYDKKYFKRLRSRIKNYEWEIIHDRALFRFFYDSCYIPTIKTRHRDNQIIKSYEEVLGFFEEGELLVLKQEGSVVAGAVNQKVGDTYYGRVLGVVNGDSSLVEQGVSGFLYFFTYCAAYQKECKKIDFGASIPFLNNGVLQYKRKWGGRIERDKTVSRNRRMIICSYRAELLRMLKKNPFICTRNNHFYGIIFLDAETGITDKQLHSLIKTCYHPGMSAIHIFVSGKNINSITDQLHKLRMKFPLPIEIFDLFNVD